MVATLYNPSIQDDPFGCTPKIVSPQDKDPDSMTPKQKLWFEKIRRRVTDPKWTFLDQTWDELKWELHYMFGYSFLPDRQETGFNPNFNGLSLLKSTGLLVVNYFWQTPRGSNTPDVGIAVKLYNITYDTQTNTVVFGGAENNSYAKNLSLMPFAGAHGPVIDYKETESIFNTALAIDNQLLLCATDVGRKFLQKPKFPKCLVGFKPGDASDSHSPFLYNAALSYLERPDNGTYLKKLHLPERGGDVVQVTECGDEIWINLHDKRVIKLPIHVKLRSGVHDGARLGAGTVLGDMRLPDGKLPAPYTWDAICEQLGDYASGWFLEAVWQQSITKHSYAGQELECVPHVLVPDRDTTWAPKFLDMRPWMGRVYIDPDEADDLPDLDNLDTAALGPDKRKTRFSSHEAAIRCVHVGRTVCEDLMSFNDYKVTSEKDGPRFLVKGDLWNVKPYWQKCFTSSKPPAGEHRRRMAA